MAIADSLFIVLEGLDGSVKTTAGKVLATRLQAYLGGKVKLSYEPNEACCAGLYIRQVLEKKINQFSYETLAYAFAANRKDHGDRMILPWINKDQGQVFISDRYYLSSLVYQSSDKLSMAEVMDINRYAIQPDVIFFLSVTPEICYQRMGTRDKPKELFEENFIQTREKYHQAIEFLQTHHQENIIAIDASGSLEEVVQLLAENISRLFPQLKDFATSQLANPSSHTLQVFQYQLDKLPLTLTQFLQESDPDYNNLSPLQKGSLFLDLLGAEGYTIADPLNLPGISGFELSFALPGGIKQRGAVMFIGKTIAPVPMMTAVELIGQRVDFIFVVELESTQLQMEFFQRDAYVFGEVPSSLFPTVKFVGPKEIERWLEGR